jgi:hypothetical protein
VGAENPVIGVSTSWKTEPEPWPRTNRLIPNPVKSQHRPERISGQTVTPKESLLAWRWT